MAARSGSTEFPKIKIFLGESSTDCSKHFFFQVTKLSLELTCSPKGRMAGWVSGAAQQVSAFGKSHWEAAIPARYPELITAAAWAFAFFAKNFSNSSKTFSRTLLTRLKP